MRSATLDFEVFDCPICFEPLTAPIFQCDNGHLACSSCCPKLKNKCPACAFPISDKRCRAMENVLESMVVSCSNSMLGCTKKVRYGDLSTHKQECTFSFCFCPVPYCNYFASYKDIYNHYNLIHLKTYMQTPIADMFTCGTSFRIQLDINDKMLIQREFEKSLLFAVQCFRKPYGVHINVSCIAPSSPEVEEFSYHLSYTVDGHSMIYKSPEVKRVRKVSFQIPHEHCMLIPRSSLRSELLEVELCIKTLNQM